MRHSKNKLKFLLIAVLFIYFFMISFLLLISKQDLIEKNNETLTVSVSDFKPAKNKEYSLINKQEILDSKNIADNIKKSSDSSKLEMSDLDVFSKESVIAEMQIDLAPSSDFIKAADNITNSDNAILQFLETGSEGLFSGTKGSSNSLLGPPGTKRGISLNSRLAGKSRKSAVSRFGGNDKTEDSVKNALRYLSRRQNDDGGWGSDVSRNTGDSVALSSLSLLAFLGNGVHYQSDEFSEVVVKGVNRLLYAAQIPGVERVGKGFGHAILIYALAEAYAVTGDLKIKPVLKNRVRAIILRQNSLGSFSIDYSNELIDEAPTSESLEYLTKQQRTAAVQVIAGEPTCDLSLLGWHIQALTAAKVAGIKVAGLDDALEYAKVALIQVHQAKGGGFSQGINAKRYPANPTLTPVGTLCMQLLGQGRNNVLKRAGTILASDQGKIPMPNWQGGIKHVDGDSFKSVESSAPFSLYRWYYLTQTLFQATKGKGTQWKRWNENLKHELLKNQETDGHWVMKSQEEDFRLKDSEDLAIYATSMAALMLEVYYRYLPSYSIKEAPKTQQDVTARLDAAKLGLLSRMSSGIDPDAAMLLGVGVHDIKPVQFGHFNGKPFNPSEPLLADEFKLYSTLSSTIHVRKIEDFPQLLQPNQRVAFFLDDLLPAGFQWHLVLRMTISLDNIHSGTHLPFLQVCMNGQTVHNECLEELGNMVTVLIPADKFVGFNNVLEIRNNGPVPWCFDAVKLETPTLPGKYLHLAAEEWDDLPKDCQYLFNTGIVPLYFSKTDKFINKFQLRRLELLKIDSSSLWSRRSATWMLKQNIEKLTKDDPTHKKVLREKALLISQMLIQKTEPMIRFHSALPQDAVRLIAAAFGPFVNHWHIYGQENIEQIAKILYEYNSDAHVVVNAEHQLGGVFYSCNHFNGNMVPATHFMQSESYDPQMQYWGRWEEIANEANGQKTQLKNLDQSGRSVIEWLSGGGSAVILGKIKNGGVYYDSLYGTSLPALTALRQVGYLFEGAPRWLPSGFFPSSSDSPALFSSSIAALNAPGMATVIVARRFPRAREFEVIAGAMEWSNSADRSHWLYTQRFSVFAFVDTTGNKDRTNYG